jgi:hypothetical protein
LAYDRRHAENVGRELPPVVEMARDEVVDWVGPTIQRYLG